MEGVMPSGNAEPQPHDQLRASDTDRKAVAERLRKAHDDGRLSLSEYDERLGAAYAGRTYADLQRLTADLPYPPAVPPSVQPAVAARLPTGSHDPGALVWRILGSAWFSVSLVNLLIWGIICVATTSLVYPWWIWVAGPWGAVLLAGWLTGIGRAKRD